MDDREAALLGAAEVIAIAAAVGTEGGGPPWLLEVFNAIEALAGTIANPTASVATIITSTQAVIETTRRCRAAGRPGNGT